MIVLNDNHNTFQGVAFALSSTVPGVDYDQGLRIADRIHNSGRAVVWSGHKEPAELYWEAQGLRADDGAARTRFVNAVRSKHRRSRGSHVRSRRTRPAAFFRLSSVKRFSSPRSRRLTLPRCRKSTAAAANAANAITAHEEPSRAAAIGSDTAPGIDASEA